ncbi:MAG: hypothetical protein M3R52_08355 [Acidobacteriota bacterium]|nr:hypothetical protein [Acidobacteriota bacterium]
MLRTVTLSLLMLVSVIVMLPFASSNAHGIRQSSAAHQQRRYRRHSRAWWRRHRARMRLRRAAAQAHRQATLGPVFAKATDRDVSMTLLSKLPDGWNNPTVANNGEVRFQAESKAIAPSQATLSVVARSHPNPAYVTQREQSRMLSGVAFSDLRRIVIEKMINAGGWVINDYERQVNGARVFVVIAQTPSDGRSPEKSWNFYFAEIDGNIYSLTLNTPLQFSGSLAAEGQKFLASLRAKSNSNRQPATQ